jgi:hypothetical protein
MCFGNVVHPGHFTCGTQGRGDHEPKHLQIVRCRTGRAFTPTP